MDENFRVNFYSYIYYFSSFTVIYRSDILMRKSENHPKLRTVKDIPRIIVPKNIKISLVWINQKKKNYITLIHITHMYS